MANTKLTLDTKTMSLAQRRFIRIFARTGDLQHASAKCFAEKEDPIAYASKILNDTQYRRSLIEYHCDNQGVTDEFLIKALSDGVKELHWNDPKSSRTKLEIIKEILKLKGRYVSEEKGRGDIHVHNNNTVVNMDSAKKQVLNEIWDRTRKNLTDEQINDVIIDVVAEEQTKQPVNSKSDLFLKPPESVDDKDIQPK